MFVFIPNSQHCAGAAAPIFFRESEKEPEIALPLYHPSNTKLDLAADKLTERLHYKILPHSIFRLMIANLKHHLTKTK